MAIDIQIITERNEVREELIDEKDTLGRNLKPKFIGNYQLLKYVDRFGTTIFNTLQLKTLILDLKIFKKNLKLNSDKEFIERLIMLIKKSSEHPLLLIRFNGD